MTDITRILSKIEQGDPTAAEHLLPIVYDELRKLAAARLAHEPAGQTLQATALVHEAYLRLVDVDRVQHWNSCGHFFGAAAEAMRRILVEQARRKNRVRHAGGLHSSRLTLDSFALGYVVSILSEWACNNLANRKPKTAQTSKLAHPAMVILNGHGRCHSAAV